MSEQQQDQQQEQQQQAGAPQERTASICPCCGQPTLPYPIKHLPDDLADQFMACLLSGTPFTHAYPLYNGRVVITVTQMTQELHDLVNRLIHHINRLADSGVAIDGVSFDNMTGVVRTLVSVNSIEIKAAGTSRVFQPVENLHRALAAFDELDPGDVTSDAMKNKVRGIYRSLTDPSEVSGVPAIQIMTTIEAHARLLTILMDSGFDENFWAGIELA
jgi:hypothetical protein